MNRTENWLQRGNRTQPQKEQQSSGKERRSKRRNCKTKQFIPKTTLSLCVTMHQTHMHIHTHTHIHILAQTHTAASTGDLQRVRLRRK
jgi:hypothetical protein